MVIMTINVTIKIVMMIVVPIVVILVGIVTDNNVIHDMKTPRPIDTVRVNVGNTLLIVMTTSDVYEDVKGKDNDGVGTDSSDTSRNRNRRK